MSCRPDGSLCGWLHLFVAHRVESDRFAELGGLVVAEEDRGKGIGRRLLAAAEQWVKGRGITKLRVRSRSSRSDAHAFYQRLGFIGSKEQLVLDKPISSGWGGKA